MHALEPVVKEWDPGSSDPAAFLTPSLSVEQVMSQVPHPPQERTCLIASCSSAMAV